MSASESDLVGSDSDSDIDAIVIDRDDISNYNPEQILPEPPETIAKIRSWLQPTSYNITGGEYRKHLASHVAGTGSWLTSSTRYQEWLQSDEHGLLWIKGIPGSGKSVMAAKLINELAKSNPGTPVLFFFFRQIIDANHEPEALLRDWMDQVLDYSPPLQKQLGSYMESRRSIESISREDMWKDLRMAFASLPGKVFCVADALDEMDQGNDTFLEALGGLGRWRTGKVKVLITSRPVPSVEGPLRNSSSLRIRLQENLVDMDISTYVQYTLSHSNIPQSDWQVIANAVPGRANGLFLYAKLAMDAFLEPGVDINTVLSQLPADLNVLYTDLLVEHARRSGVTADIQHLILQAVTHATRPLRLLELAEMIKVNSPGDSTLDLKLTKNLIRAACGPLLEILADETVSVIHHSFTEYLKGATRSNDGSGYPILQLGSTHARLAIACLRYLQAGCLNSVKIKIKDNDDDAEDWDSYNPESKEITKPEAQLRLKYPFFAYAASNWHYHINKSEAVEYDQSEIIPELQAFLGDTKTVKAWLQMKWPGSDRAAGLVTQLHIAAKTGLIAYTKELLDMKHAELDALDVHGKTPLWWAATEGHAAAMRVLIAAGANPDQDDAVCGLKPLHEAANNNHHEAVKVLLEAGVDPLTKKTRENPGRTCGNAPRTSGHTPLMYACRNGHLEALAAFLPFIKDIDIVHRALAWAAETGRSKLVSLILQHPGVDVNARVRGCTPLYEACDSLDLATIKVILQAGADARIKSANKGNEFGGGGFGYYYGTKEKDPYNMTCLHKICGMGVRGAGLRELEPDDLHTMFSLLVQAGVDIHERTASGETALHGAVGSPVLTRLLLDVGADANATDESGNAPLHKSVTIDSMTLLIEQGHADINLANSDGLTPLLGLLSSYHVGVAHKLLEYGADCNVTNKNGDGALHLAVQQWSSCPSIVKALLEGGADPNLKNLDGLTPLLSLRNGSRDSTGMVDVLLEAGADINAADRSGATLLFRMLSLTSYGHGEDSHKDLRDLMDRGASTSIRDFYGRTLLHEAVMKHEISRLPRSSYDPKTPRFDFLVERGLDINAVDFDGNGLLHELALRTNNHDSYSGPGIVAFWKQLLAMGLDLEQKNHAGRTPLHILCSTGIQSRHVKPGDFMPIDFVISQVKNLDNADNDGITPLHMAATGQDVYAKKLIDAGADPAAITHERLTPLHIAARCRASNTVGFLLDALRTLSRKMQAADSSSQHTETDTLTSVEANSSLCPVIGVNAKAFEFCTAITPLHYACRSGRPETVALLLEAGADAGLDGIFQACVDFEDEDGLWQNRHQPTNGRERGVPIAVKLHDSSRPCLNSQYRSRSSEVTEHDTVRLEEILDMLVKYGADISKLDPHDKGGGVIADAVANNKDYAAACLRHVRDKLTGDSEKRSNGVVATLSRAMDNSSKRASIQTLKDCKLIEPERSNEWMLHRFLIRREYHLIEELSRQGASFLSTPGRSETCNLAVLVKHGFVALVKKIGSTEAELRLDRGDWHAFGDKTKPGLWFANRDISDLGNKSYNPLPFLLEAVQRALPNMDMVQLLVEEFGVDIDEMLHTKKYIDGDYETVPTESAIFYVARGNSWWHAHQALPYLLKAGANVHVRNYEGQTPLHMALRADGNWPGPFSADAARALVKAGADVNAVDKRGQSCLACAQHNVDMIEFLISHGATVTPDAVFAAIDAKNVGVLRALMSGGIDANIRRNKPPEEGPEQKKRKVGRSHLNHWMASLEAHEEYPLYHAGMGWRSPRGPGVQTSQDIEAVHQLVQVLLDCGGNPFAKFLKPNTASDKLNDTTTDTPSIKVPNGYEECTILHELFLDGKLADNYFYLPGLDVNHRDAKGRTLLHTACQGRGGPDYIIGSAEGTTDQTNYVTVFQRLLFLGADLEARDNFGRNCLHSMIDNTDGNDFDRFKDAFDHILKKAPHLINQADRNGETPLHYAAERAANRGNPQVAELLVSAGADALAVSIYGDSALHILAQNLDGEPLRTFFEDLVARGINVNARNALGETPLFSFYKRDKRDSGYSYHYDDSDSEEFPEKEATVMLGKLGADFFARDDSGRGLLHVAASGEAHRFKELMDMGVDVMWEDNGQRTAIDVAAACGNEDVLALFENKE